MSDNPTIPQRIRSFLNRAIKGNFTNAMIEALAAGDEINSANILALKDNLFIATAEDRFLEKLLAAQGIIKPAEVGIDDDSFRNMAIAVTNNKLVSNVFFDILELFFGEDAVKSNILSQTFEPYTLTDGMDLYIQQDGIGNSLRVEFKTSDFRNIAQASAVEIASVISRESSKAGYNIYAMGYLDAASNNTSVQILSGTKGPKSAITITGGSAQNIFRFPAIRGTTQMAGTQFDYTVSGIHIRYTWTSGADPGLQNVEVGDYVNIKLSSGLSDHNGSFTITSINPDVVGAGYFEVINPLVQISGTVTLADDDAMRFFYPKKSTLNDLTRFASMYEINPYEVVIFMPASTRIVKRDLVGSWHIHADASDKSYLGSYIYDTTTGFTISEHTGYLNGTVNAGRIYNVVQVNGTATQFPDSLGYLVFDYGTSNQEGPVRYLGRPSNSTLLIDPSYTFKKTHVNPDITLISSVKAPQLAIDGSDMAAYLTGTTAGRQKAEQIMSDLMASGIFMSIIVVYPQNPGWNNPLDVYAGDQT